MTQLDPAPADAPSVIAQRSIGRVGRGSVANFAGALISAAATFGVTVALTRGLPQNDAGVFFSCTSLFLLAVAVGQLGTTTGLVYFLSRARALQRQELVLRYIRAARTPVVLASVLAGAVLIVGAPLLARWTNPGNVEIATTYLRVFGAFTPVASIVTLNLSASRGMGMMRPTVLVEQIGRPVMQFALVLPVVFLHATPALPYAWAVCFILGAVRSRKLISAQLDRARPFHARPRPVGREFWAFTWPRALGNVAQTAIQRFDIVLVGVIVGPGPAAIYTASTRFLVLGQLGNRAVSLSAQPRIAEALARGVRADVNHVYRTSTAWLMIATWPIYLLFATVGGPLLAVFGRGYATQGRALLAVLSVAMLISTGCGMVDMVLNMAGRTSWNLVNVLIAFGVNLGVDLILIPRIGILGAAIGWAAAIVFQNAFSLTAVGLAEHVHPFGRATASVAVSGLACFGALPLAVQLVVGEHTLTSVVLTAAAGSIVYAVLLWSMRDLLQLKALIQLRRSRTTGPPSPVSPDPGADT